MNNLELYRDMLHSAVDSANIDSACSWQSGCVIAKFFDLADIPLPTHCSMVSESDHTLGKDMDALMLALQVAWDSIGVNTPLSAIEAAKDSLHASIEAFCDGEANNFYAAIVTAGNSTSRAVFSGDLQQRLLASCLHAREYGAVSG